MLASLFILSCFFVSIIHSCSPSKQYHSSITKYSVKKKLWTENKTRSVTSQAWKKNFKVLISRAVIKFWVTCNLVRSTPVTSAKLLLCGWILSTKNNFMCSIKKKSSILSCHRCYGLQPLMQSSQVSRIEHETHANKFNLTLSRWNYYFSCI